MVLFSNLNINSPKYESAFLAKKRVQEADQCQIEKMAALPPSMSLIIRQQERSLGYYTCSALGHMSGSILGTDLSFAKDAKHFFLLLLQQWGAGLVLLAVLQKTVVVSDTDGVESLTLHIIYQLENDSVILCAHYFKGPPVPVCTACLWATAGRGHVSMWKINSFTLCYIFL